MAISDQYSYTAENVFLEVAAEYGLVGLLLMLLAIAEALRGISGSSEASPYRWGVMMLLAVGMVQSLKHPSLICLLFSALAIAKGVHVRERVS